MTRAYAEVKRGGAAGPSPGFGLALTSRGREGGRPSNGSLLPIHRRSKLSAARWAYAAGGSNEASLCVGSKGPKQSARLIEKHFEEQALSFDREGLQGTIFSRMNLREPGVAALKGNAAMSVCKRAFVG